MPLAGMAKLADALGLGPSERNLMGVQVPLPALYEKFLDNLLAHCFDFEWCVHVLLSNDL